MSHLQSRHKRFIKSWYTYTASLDQTGAALRGDKKYGKQTAIVDFMDNAGVSLCCIKEGETVCLDQSAEVE